MFNCDYRGGTSGCLPESPSTAESLSDGTADVASKINPPSANSFEGEAV
jgi:hypothetical protein